METNKFDVDFLHNFFCKIIDCEKLSEDDLKIISLDELDYIDKIEEEAIRLSEDISDISSIYKQFSDGHYEIYVNEDKLKEEPFITVEILFSQLMDFYTMAIPYFINAKGLIEKLNWVKSISNGYNIWYEFSTICMASRVSYILFQDAEIDMNNPYSDDNYKENINTLLKSIENNTDSASAKFSIILYSLGKLTNIDPALDAEIKNINQLNKLKFIDVSEIFEKKELGELINELYILLVKSTTTSPNIALFVKLQKLGMKILKLL